MGCFWGSGADSTSLSNSESSNNSRSSAARPVSGTGRPIAAEATTLMTRREITPPRTATSGPRSPFVAPPPNTASVARARWSVRDPCGDGVLRVRRCVLGVRCSRPRAREPPGADAHDGAPRSLVAPPVQTPRLRLKARGDFRLRCRGVSASTWQAQGSRPPAGRRARASDPVNPGDHPRRAPVLGSRTIGMLATARGAFIGVCSKRAHVGLRPRGARGLARGGGGGWHDASSGWGPGCEHARHPSLPSGREAVPTAAGRGGGVS